MKIKGLIIVLLLLFSNVAQAHVLVLVHGYLSKGGSWREAGVTRVLDSSGWKDGGHLRIVGERITNYHPATGKANQTYYTLDMPSEAPLVLHAKFLANYMSAIQQRHAGESPVRGRLADCAGRARTASVRG